MRPFNTLGGRDTANLTPPISNYVETISLNGSAAATVTWPTGATYCNVAGPSDYWVRVGGTAAVPSGTTSDGSGSAYRPAQRRKGNETSFSIISNVASYVTIEFWAEESSLGN